MPRQEKNTLSGAAEWWKGYTAGRKNGISTSIQYFEKMIREMEIPGIGPKTKEKLILGINERLEGDEYKKGASE